MMTTETTEATPPAPAADAAPLSATFADAHGAERTCRIAVSDVRRLREAGTDLEQAFRLAFLDVPEDDALRLAWELSGGGGDFDGWLSPMSGDHKEAAADAAAAAVADFLPHLRRNRRAAARHFRAVRRVSAELADRETAARLAALTAGPGSDASAGGGPGPSDQTPAP